MGQIVNEEVRRYWVRFLVLSLSVLSRAARRARPTVIVLFQYCAFQRLVASSQGETALNTGNPFDS